jgi:hypothetical protein
MKFFLFFICFCFMFINSSFSQYILIKGYGGGDRQFPSLIIARNFSDIASVIDTSILKERFTKELILLEHESDYGRVSNFVRSYKGTRSVCRQPMFYISDYSIQGDFEYCLKGKDLFDFLHGLNECLKKSMQYTEIKNNFENYRSRICRRLEVGN